MRSSVVRRLSDIVTVLGLLAAGGSAAAEGSCASWQAGLRAAEVVTFHAASAEESAILEKAIAEWSVGCGAAYGHEMPRLEVRETAAEATYHVRVDRYNPNGSQCGWLRGREIRVFRFAHGPSGERLHCGQPELVLAHEIGHGLGLDDADVSRCPQAIMATIHRGNRSSRRVQRAECAAVGEAWLSREEVTLLAGRAPGERNAPPRREEPAIQSTVSTEERLVSAPRTP